MSNETIFIDFFQSVANLPGSKSNSKNIDPKSESSFARFFSNETIFNDFFQSLANFPAKGLLAREAKALKVLFLFCSDHLGFFLERLFRFLQIMMKYWFFYMNSFIKFIKFIRIFIIRILFIYLSFSLIFFNL